MIIAEVEAAEAAQKDPEVGWQTRKRISALRPSAPHFRVPRRAKRRVPSDLYRVSMQPFLVTPSAPSVSLQPLRSSDEPSSSSTDIELARVDSGRRRHLPDGEAENCEACRMSSLFRRRFFLGKCSSMR